VSGNTEAYILVCLHVQPCNYLWLLLIVGQYCPEGSSAQQGCDSGMYCDVDMMSSPRGNCSAGYYCSSNSSSQQPTGTGGRCYFDIRMRLH